MSSTIELLNSINTAINGVSMAELMTIHPDRACLMPWLLNDDEHQDPNGGQVIAIDQHGEVLYLSPPPIPLNTCVN